MDDDDDMPMMLGADDAAAGDDMSGLQASQAAEERGSDSDSEEDSEEDSDSDSEDDEEDDDGDDKEKNGNEDSIDKNEKSIPPKEKDVKSDAPKLMEDTMKVGQDEKNLYKGKKSKKKKKSKEFKKDKADDEKNISKTKSQKVTAKKKNEVPDKKNKTQSKPEDDSVSIDDDGPMMLGGNDDDAAVDDDDDDADIKADVLKTNLVVTSDKELAASNADVEKDFKKEKNSTASMQTNVDEKNAATLQDDDNNGPEPLHADDVAQDDDDIIPGQASQESGKEGIINDDGPGFLVTGDVAQDEDDNDIIPGQAAHEDEKEELADTKTKQKDTNDNQVESKYVEVSKITTSPPKTLQLPPMDDNEKAMYDYAAECKEAFAFVDKTEQGTISIEDAIEGLHCLGLCPFICDIDAMKEEAGTKNIDFSFFMTHAMRVRKREMESKKPGDVVLDTWKRLDEFQGFNGKIHLDNLKGMLSQMGDAFDESEMRSAFKDSRLYVDDDGMLDFSKWLKSEE